MKFLVFFAIIFIGLQFCSCESSDFMKFLDEILGIKTDPDTFRNVSLLISTKGYPVEDHDVVTKDGYILSVQHIPHGKNESKNGSQSKDVVFLQHGLLSSSTDFVINFEAQSLGFILADAGYDVWLGNIRGNTYSRRHIKYTPNMREFWNFSFDEMAVYDLPAMIDYVLNETSKDKLVYIGHSQGTTAAFALLSELPEYNEKVKLMIGLAPVATVGHIGGILKFLAHFTTDVQFLFKILGINEFLPSNAAMNFFTEVTCDTRLKVICEDIIFLICGTDIAQLNETRLGVYTAHTPAGASTQSVIHYAQMVRSKKFQKFDYGKEENSKHYNQTTPPEYNIGNIKTPVALFWSLNDKLADPIDVGILENNLKSIISSTCVKNPLFNHLDFVWGLDARQVVYEDVLAILKKYAV